MKVSEEKQVVVTKSGKVQELTSQQEELIDLATTTSWNNKKIADTMGVPASWVWSTLKKQHVKDVMHERIKDQIMLGACSAITKVRELVNHRSGYVALEASKDLLDRAGYKPPDRSQVAVGGEVSIKIDLGG